MSPLYASRDGAGELITVPQPINTVPARYFYRNTDGYGFDVRNLGVLLRTNFRNMNPHTLDEHTGEARPLWCNADDLRALIHHPELPEAVRETVARRSRWLNLLSDLSKVRLAEAARELYSATLQGFYTWVAELEGFDSIMTAVGVDASRASILARVSELQRRRRASTIAAIAATLGTQAAEHFCEPAGVTDADLYGLLEIYKGGVAQRFIGYIAELGERRRVILRNLTVRLETYSTTKLARLVDRYVLAAQRRPARRAMEPLFSIRYAEVGKELQRVGKPRARLLRRPPRPRGDVQIEVWLVRRGRDEPPAVELHLNEARFPVADTSALLKMLNDLVPHFLPRARYRVARAALSGGILGRIHSGRGARQLHRHGNGLLRALADQWLSRHSFVETVEATVLDGAARQLYLPTQEERVRAIRTALRRRYRDAMFRVVAEQMARSAPDIFEFHLISVQVRGGYDDFTGTLLDKLRATMAGRTCAQDVGGELCEMLSYPYPPEQASRYAGFQVDHTGVPALIAREPRHWSEPTVAFDRSVYRLLHPITEVPEPASANGVYSMS